MKRLVTLMSSAVMFISMFAVPATQVSAATSNTPPANTTQVSTNTSSFQRLILTKLVKQLTAVLLW